MSTVRGGSACGPLTLWRFEEAMLAVRHRSHLVVPWSRQVLPRTLCHFWWRFFPGVLCVRFGPPLCCPCSSKCPEHCFRYVPDSVGFCGSRVCGPTSVGGRGVVLFSFATL
ncbi:hypothetical protein Taro_041863 [Colocasia esculenta]|uniref:Uncharacterized protein n=1 Tax=Colocasia esculenta TaxID=4460 RepID=A0A843WYE3_COLES|nr:hypothetical protein [Colocasia esculenta]